MGVIKTIVFIPTVTVKRWKKTITVWGFGKERFFSAFYIWYSTTLDKYFDAVVA